MKLIVKVNRCLYDILDIERLDRTHEEMEKEAEIYRESFVLN
jgi:hypothetical protein